jgi:hypothetical protein
MAVTLPTDPHTVIRVAWLPDAFQRDEDAVLMLEENGYWRGPKGLYLPALLAKDISGYRLLAKPVPVEDVVVFTSAPDDLLLWVDVPPADVDFENPAARAAAERRLDRELGGLLAADES